MAVRQEVDCLICLNLLCDPVTLPTCGHSFCRNCIVNALERSHKRCPVCRTPCCVSAHLAPVNVTLRNVLELLFPAHYAERVVEAQQERAMWDAKMPVFCMPQPLFPGQPLSLHLFEPRYRLMMERMAAAPTGAKKRFCYLSTPDPAEGAIGVIVELTSMRRLPTGTFLVTARGECKCRIAECWREEGTEGLNYARVESWRDEDEAAIAALATAAVSFIRNHLRDAFLQERQLRQEHLLGRRQSAAAAGAVSSSSSSSLAALRAPAGLSYFEPMTVPPSPLAATAAALTFSASFASSSAAGSGGCAAAAGGQCFHPFPSDDAALAAIDRYCPGPLEIIAAAAAIGPWFLLATPTTSGGDGGVAEALARCTRRIVRGPLDASGSSGSSTSSGSASGVVDQSADPAAWYALSTAAAAMGLQLRLSLGLPEPHDAAAAAADASGMAVPVTPAASTGSSCSHSVGSPASAGSGAAARGGGSGGGGGSALPDLSTLVLEYVHALASRDKQAQLAASGASSVDSSASSGGTGSSSGGYGADRSSSARASCESIGSGVATDDGTTTATASLARDDGDAEDDEDGDSVMTGTGASSSGSGGAHAAARHAAGGAPRSGRHGLDAGSSGGSARSSFSVHPAVGSSAAASGAAAGGEEDEGMRGSTSASRAAATAAAFASAVATTGDASLSSSAAATTPVTSARMRAAFRQHETIVAVWRTFALCMGAIQAVYRTLDADAVAQATASFGPVPSSRDLCTGAGLLQATYWMCGVLPLPLEHKQYLLETSTVGERLWALLHVLWPAYGAAATGIDTEAADLYAHCGEEMQPVHEALAPLMIDASPAAAPAAPGADAAAVDHDAPVGAPGLPADASGLSC